MKKPEPIELENNLGPDAVTGEINRVPWMAYDVDEMDLYIAEKDKEIAELKQKLDEKDKDIESLKASHYAEMVDAGMRERRLRRALYKACANWAHHRVYVRFRTNEKAWENVERKCRAKAEGYK